MHHRLVTETTTVGLNKQVDKVLHNATPMWFTCETDIKLFIYCLTYVDDAFGIEMHTGERSKQNVLHFLKMFLNILEYVT